MQIQNQNKKIIEALQTTELLPFSPSLSSLTKCPKCKCKFFSENDLKSHLETHHRKMQVTCHDKRKVVFEDWQLPGGGPPLSDCGQTRFRGCLNLDEHPQSLTGRPAGQAYVEIYHRSCFKASCPICHGDWERREATRAEHRLGTYKVKKKAIHLIVSPPRSDWNLSIEELREKAYKFSKKAGFWGGCSVLHLWRKGRFSPHFHMVGFGWITKMPEVYRRTGWLVWNLGIRKSVYHTLTYELGHAATNKKYHSLTWFGSLAYCKFKAPPLEEVKPRCPLCQRELVKLLWIGETSGDPPSKVGSYYLDPGGWCESIDMWRAYFQFYK